MEESAMQSPFDLLPDAIVVDVLSRLSHSVLQDERARSSLAKGDCCDVMVRLQSVSKRFRSLLGLVPELGWKLRGSRDERGLVRLLLRSAGSLKKLRLSLGSQYRASQELEAGLARICGALEELEAVQLCNEHEQSTPEQHFDYPLLFNLLSQSKTLSSLTLTRLISLPLTQTTLSPLPSVRHLKLTSAFLSDNTLLAITDCCPNLETLHLDYVQGLQDTLIQSSPLQSFRIENGPYPESLSIDAPSLTSMDLSVGEMLSIAAPQLQTLIITSGLPELDVRQPWSVTTLRLTGYYWLWDHIEALLRVCPNLRTLDIDVKNQLGLGVSIPFCKFLLRMCPQVQELKLALGLLAIMECTLEDIAEISEEGGLPLQKCAVEIDVVTESLLNQLDFIRKSASSLESLRMILLGTSRPASGETRNVLLRRLLELGEDWSALEIVFEPSCPGWTQWR